MPEQTEEQEIETTGSRLSSSARLKRLVITAVFLILFIPFFGKILPSILFGPPKEKNVETTEKQAIPPLQKPEPVATSSPAHSPVAQPETAPVADAPKQEAESETQESAPEPPYTDNSSQPPVPTPAPPQAEDERIRALEEKIARLEAAQGSAVSSLENKMASQNSEFMDKTSSLLSALVIFGQMKDAIKNGEAYDIQLEQIKKFARNEQQAADIISSLAENAATGIATPANLKSRFNPLARQVIASLAKNPWSGMLHKFITIRKTGEQAGDDDEAVLARAEVKLTQGDVGGALKEISKLTPDSQELFSPWTQDAQNWLDTNDGLSKLQLLLTKTTITAEP